MALSENTGSADGYNYIHQDTVDVIKTGDEDFVQTHLTSVLCEQLKGFNAEFLVTNGLIPNTEALSQYLLEEDNEQDKDIEDVSTLDDGDTEILECATKIDESIQVTSAMVAYLIENYGEEIKDNQNFQNIDILMQRLQIAMYANAAWVVLLGLIEANIPSEFEGLSKELHRNSD